MKNVSVLVHCLAGVSRSVTITLAYLMFARGLGLNDAFTFVRARKPDVSPNFHFMEQLHTFENQLKNDPNRRIMQSASMNCLSASTSTSTTPSTFESNNQTPSSTGSATSLFRDNRGARFLSRHVKYSCTCNELDCKCLQQSHDLLGPTGVSPDSGIEFDRWTPSSENTPKWAWPKF